MKLQPKILILVVGILIVSFGALSVPLFWYTRGALESELNRRLLNMAETAGGQLNRDLLRNLAREPALTGVRLALEQELAYFLKDGIEGIAVYSEEGVELARKSLVLTNQRQIAALLQTFTDQGNITRQVVSEIYRLPGGEYFKTAAIVIDIDDEPAPILAVWGGVEFMSEVDQLLGSLFWFVLIAIIVAVSLAIVFSRSLIRPVTKLSAYARAIQTNIHTDEMTVQRNDELGDLSRSLVEMHAEIRHNEQSMKRLLSGIAHDIKNPLGGIEIYTGLLEESLLKQPDEQDLAEHRSYLGKVTKELSHLKRIVLEYLDYARPQKSELQPLALEAVIADIHLLLQPELKQQGVDYKLTGSGVVTGDESKLRRVFLNLLKNSLEAVDDAGAINIHIENRPETVAVSVSDNGRGIPETDLDSIFDPYFTTHDKGYGLGLALVKNIVDEMSGTIIVDSQVGQGTKFTLNLPNPKK